MANWPEYDEAKTVDSTVEVAVQINGKLKNTIMLPLNCPKDDAIAAAKADERIAAALEGKTIVKEIAVPNRIVNIVVR
jgi:leucyl-tRNA synthetase